MQIHLPEPHAAQQLILDSNARFKVLCCGRQFGKTLISQIIAIQYMLEGKKVGYVMPTADRCKDPMREIVERLPEAIIKNWNKSEMLIELVTGGFIKFMSGEKLDNFRGKRFHFVIIDEAAEIVDLENAWQKAIRATLSFHKGNALFVSTPRGKNYFYKLFELGQEKINEYESFHFPSSANPHLDPMEIEKSRKELTTASFNQEYLALVTENDRNPFAIESIEKCTVDELSTNETIIFGIDVAKYHDWSVIIGLDEAGAMTYFDRFQLSWEETENKIKQLPPDVLKVMDATGVGDVLYERLEYQCRGLEDFKFNRTSKPEIMKELIADVNAKRLKFIGKVADEMYTFEHYETASGNVKYEAQKGANIFDDCVCALAIANHKRRQGIVRKDWRVYSA